MLHGLLCGVLYTESPGTAPVPKMQINVFTGSGGGVVQGEPGGGEQACSAGHTPVLTLLGMMDAASAVA